MAVTLEQIEAYKELIRAAGAIQQVTVGGQVFTFRSLPEMRAQLAAMQRDYAAAQQGSTTRYASISKGV